MNSNTNNNLQELTNNQLQEVVRRLAEAFHPEQIILFGSYAYGMPTQDSDFDLLVIVSHSEYPRYRRARFAYTALRGISLPTDVIVMTRNEVEKKKVVWNSLVRQVLAKGKIIYGRKKSGNSAVVDQKST